jgi:hypothetical protein
MTRTIDCARFPGRFVALLIDRVSLPGWELVHAGPPNFTAICIAAHGSQFFWVVNY